MKVDFYISSLSSGGAEHVLTNLAANFAEHGEDVSVKRLIANVFWLICKDERKRRNDRLGEGGSIFPYIKTYRAF